MKKPVNIISSVLLVAVAAALAAILVLKLICGMEMKAVMSGSMEPELPVGSLLVIKPVPYEEIEVGDDITFVRDANLTLVTHRVIEKDDSARLITTQGIANNTPDNPTSFDNVVGKVVFHIPLAGYLVIWTSTLQGKIIAGIIIVSLVATSLLFPDCKKGGKKQKNASDSTAFEGGNQNERES